jgi:AsmA protein
MKHKLRIAGIVIGVIVVAVIALPFGLNANSFRPKLESELSSALGRPVTMGNLSLSILAGNVSAQDLTIADDPAFGQGPFVRAKSLKVGVEILPLIFSKSLHVTELTLDHPEITLLRSATGTWNFSSLGATNASAAPSWGVAGGSNTPSSQPATADLAVKKLDVKEGRLTVGHADTGQTHIYDNVNIAVRNFSFGAQFPFTFSAVLPNGGTLKLDGNAGPINSSDTSLTPFQAQISMKQLDLAASGIGEFSPGISGVADFDGTVSSDGQEVRTAGTLQAQRLQLVKSGGPAGRPVQLKYALAHQLHSQTGTISESDIAMGRAVAQLAGSYQIQGDTANLDMKLNATNAPVDDLEAMLPALGVVLPSGSRLSGGTLSTNLTITGPASGPVIAGSIRLSNSRLAGFDLGSKLSSISKLSGAKTGADTSIQNLSTEARVAPDGVRTEKVNLTIAALGVLTGSGTISPGGALNYQMTANLNGAVASAVTQMVGLGDKGESVPFFIRGTTSNPSFVPDVKGMLTGQIGSQIGSLLKSKLQKSGQKNSVNSPTFPGQKSFAAQKASQPAPQQKSSVMNKLTGWFHKKKKDQNSKK